MSEIRVGTWNALNAFGDEELSGRRMYGGLEVVKRMDADVVAIQETARHGIHDEVLERERLENVIALMGNQGYRGFITDYTPLADERNAHYMSIWTRIGHVNSGMNEAVWLYGKRNALRVCAPGMGLNVYSVHLDDRYPKERVSSAKALIESRVEHYPSEAIVMGDFNDMYRNDRKGKTLRALGKVVNGIEVGDYYDESKKIQRLAGKAIRVCRMSGGQALAEFANAGFRDADPTYQPTIGSGRLALQLDHILGSSGVSFEDFTIHARSVRPGGEPLSDHSPITARAKW